MVRYGYDPHTCLLLFAPGHWGNKTKDKVFELVNSKFLSFGNEQAWGWDEKEWHQVSLFDPINPMANEEWGSYGEIRVCELCQGLQEVLQSKRGSSGGLILLSHSQLESEQKKDFISFILEQQEIKKVFFLEIERIQTTGKITEERVEKEVASITDMKMNKSEFLQMLEDDDVKPSIVYEILKEWY